MTIDVSEVITDPELTQPFVVHRPTVTVANEGVASVTYTDISLIGVVEPASPREIAMLPEGDRSSEIMNFWCALELLPSDGKATRGDIAETTDGSKYIVLKSERWQTSGYFKTTAKRYVS